MLKPILSDLNMTPIVAAVNIAYVEQFMSDGTFTPPDSLSRSAQVMLGEIQRAEALLRPLRAATRAPAATG
jgi:hypothetical protein